MTIAVRLLACSVCYAMGCDAAALRAERKGEGKPWDGREGAGRKERRLLSRGCEMRGQGMRAALGEIGIGGVQELEVGGGHGGRKKP